MTAFPAPGSQLGRYRLGRQRGAYGAAAAYDATDTGLARAVGVTVVVAEPARPADLRHRLAGEATAAAPEHGLHLLDVTESDTAVCLVTQPLPDRVVHPWLGEIDAVTHRPAGPPPAAPAPVPWNGSTPTEAPDYPRRRRWPLLVAAGVVLALVLAGLGWAYSAGRLGFGPLSSRDKAAAAVVAAAMKPPSWADRSVLPCASDKLLHASRAGDLEDHGLIEADDAAPHGWRFTGRWQSDDARAYTQGLLECSHDWSTAIGRLWHLRSAHCLAEVGTFEVAGVLAQAELRPRDDGLADDNKDAAGDLDDCYAEDPPAPTGKVKPGYRSVRFVLTNPRVPNGVATLSAPASKVGRSGTTTAYSAPTTTGSQRTCLEVKAVVRYAWDTSRTTARRLCGTSAPPTVRWVRQPHCDSAPGCIGYEVRVGGFRPFTTLTVLTRTSGNFRCGAYCRKRISVGADGRGVGSAFYFAFAPHGTMTAKVGRYADTVHFR